MSALITTFLLSAHPAHAHADDLLEGIDVLIASPALAAEMSFGLLWADDGAQFSWLCHEAITTDDALITPRYAISGDGTLLAAVPALDQARETDQPVYRSVDGCDWDPVAGLDAETIPVLIADPHNPAGLLAATANTDTPNDLFRSSDDGLTWESLGINVEGRLFSSADVGPEGTYWATAANEEGTEAWVYHSTDHGKTWQENAIAIPQSEYPYSLDLIATSAEDPMTAWMVRGPFGDDVVLKTSDGGTSTVEVFSDGVDIIDGASDEDGGVWLAAAGLAFYYAEDGATFAYVENAPVGLGVASAADATYIAARAALLRVAIVETTDQGQSFTDLLPLSEILPPPTCPADSHSAQFCDPLWEELSGRLSTSNEDTGSSSQENNDTGTAPNPTENNKGCRSGTTQAIPVLLLLGLGWRRAHTKDFS